MQYKIIPAKDLQAGDVIFTNGGDEGVHFCGRVIRENVPRPRPDVTEWRVEVVVGDGPEGEHTTVGFRHDTLVGVAREDAVVGVDIGAILSDLEES